MSRIAPVPPQLAPPDVRAVYDSAEEFRIGPLNPLFGLIMSVERWTIRRGARWPFGGSLLLVARKPAG